MQPISQEVTGFRSTTYAHHNKNKYKIKFA